MRTNPLLLLFASASLSACAFQDGDPWGEARFALSVGLDDGGRAEGDALRTSKDYLVTVESFEVTFDTVSLGVSAGGGATAFDPSDPPEGYSLCHNGHCHADSGELVDYDDIALEAAGAAEASAVQPIVQTVSLTPEMTNVPMEACGDACALTRGGLTAVSLVSTGATLEVHVTDRRSGDAQRLPDEGIDVVVQLTDAITWQAPVTGAINGRRDPVVEVDLAFTVPVAVFDAVDWASADTDIQNTFAAALADETLLIPTTHRTPFD